MLVWEVMTKCTFPQSFGKSIVSLRLSGSFHCGCGEWEDAAMATKRRWLNSHQLTCGETLFLSLLGAPPGHIEFVSRVIREAFGLT